MDAGGMADLRDIPGGIWLALVVIAVGFLVFVGIVPRWVELAGMTVGTYGLLTVTLFGSIILSINSNL